MTQSEYLVVNASESNIKEKSTTWWNECCTRNAPYIVVKRYRTKADLHWDTYSIDSDLDHEIRNSPYLNGFFQALLEVSSVSKKDMVWNEAGFLYKLPVTDAEKIAKTIALLFNEVIKNGTKS